MSTEHLCEETKAARASLGKLAAASRARAGEVRKELEGLEKETSNVLIGARGAVRAIEDDREVVLEELGQLKEILGTAEPVSSTPPTPPVPPVQPPPVAVVPQPDVHPVPVVPVTPVCHPDPNPTQQQPAVIAPAPANANATAIAVVNQHDPRNWTGVQWLLALIGLLVGVMVWSFWPEWPGRNIGNSGVKTFVNFVWFIAHGCVGFFIGGFIGSVIDRRRA